MAPGGAQKPGHVEGAKLQQGLPGRSYAQKRAALGARSHREDTLLLERLPKGEKNETHTLASPFLLSYHLPPEASTG